MNAFIKSYLKLDMKFFLLNRSIIEVYLISLQNLFLVHQLSVWIQALPIHIILCD